MPAIRAGLSGWMRIWGMLLSGMAVSCSSGTIAGEMRTGYRGAGSQNAPVAVRLLTDAFQQLRRRLLMQDQGQAHHAARGADEELAHRLVVQFVEVDLGKDHRRGGLALEAVDRFEQHVALAVDRLPEQVVFAGEAAQRGLAEAVVGHQLRMLATVVADDGDVVLLESRRVAVAHRFLDLGDQPGAVGVGVDGDLVGGDRRGGVDLQVARAAGGAASPPPGAGCGSCSAHAG